MNQVNQTLEPTFVIAMDGSICLAGELKTVNAKIEKARQQAEIELKAREDQAKKLSK